MDKDKYRIIKIGKEALYEFIYEKFIENQEEYLGVNALEVMNSFEIDFQNGNFIFIAHKSEDENENIIPLPKEIDLVKLMDKMGDTTSTMFGKDRYIELSLKEIIDIQERKIATYRGDVMNRIVKVVIDRPLGSYHPKHKDIYYSVNYGYVPGIIAPDGEEQDAYVLGINEPIKELIGKVVAIIHRNDDVEEKWVVVPQGMKITKAEIQEQVNFQEKYFDSLIEMLI
ncbi:inorganic pyrophosphatase [Clostridium sp. LS]|uniref:inorganic pyrophosphatase n=1 Tax=unclassified Clostridium TaxID=2614128 RepID=UPI00029841DD|nr:MAG: inorganic pyrophosphatase [Clostridium sp. Maddingley MBC34-26]